LKKQLKKQLSRKRRAEEPTTTSTKRTANSAAFGRVA
jgi:hypothetical protein